MNAVHMKPRDIQGRLAHAIRYWMRDPFGVDSGCPTWTNWFTVDNDMETANLTTTDDDYVVDVLRGDPTRFCLIRNDNVPTDIWVSCRKSRKQLGGDNQAVKRKGRGGDGHKSDHNKVWGHSNGSDVGG